MNKFKKFFLISTFLSLGKLNLSKEIVKTKWEGFSLKILTGAKIGKEDKSTNLTFQFNGIPLISGSGQFMIGCGAGYGIVHKNLYVGFEANFSSLSFIPILNANIGFANDYFALGGGVSLILWGLDLFYRHALTRRISLETKMNLVLSGEAFNEKHELHDSRFIYSLGLRFTI